MPSSQAKASKKLTSASKIAASLEQHTAQLESLFANAPVGLAFVDREHRYLRINERLAFRLEVRDYVGSLPGPLRGTSQDLAPSAGLVFSPQTSTRTPSRFPSTRICGDLANGDCQWCRLRGHKCHCSSCTRASEA